MKQISPAKRMLAVIEMKNGDVLGVELKPLIGLMGLNYAVDVWPGSGSVYLGEGRWDLAPEVKVDLSASGLYTATQIINPVAWLTEKAQNTPNQANKAVNGSVSPELGGNG